MKKNLALVCMFLLMVSCETQLGTAISTSFTNLVTGDGFSNPSSDRAYEKLKEETTNSMLSPDKQGNSNCVKYSSIDTIISDKKTNPLKEIKDNMCSCKAWGTCDNKSCQCEQLCPKNFEIFEYTKNATNDDRDNSLSFTNGDEMFYTNDPHYNGYCWGYAVVTQRFNRLAKFNPSKSKFSPNDSVLRLRELKSLIKKLDNNEPIEIPGYKNLQEFSSDPEVRELLADSVKKNWAQNAMSTQGLGMIASGKPQGADYYNNLFNDLDFRLKHNQSPAIVFNLEEHRSVAHTVLVSGRGVTPEGVQYICIRDNNVEPERNYNCQNRMFINADGTISYSLWSISKIGKVELSYTENSNSLEQMSNLQKKCLGDKDCPIITQAVSQPIQDAR
jgi:hypothetical protein